MFHRTPQEIIAREWAKAFRRMIRQTTRGTPGEREHAFRVLQWLDAQYRETFGLLAPAHKDDTA